MPSFRRYLKTALAAAAVLALAGGAAAQILPGVGAPQLPDVGGGLPDARGSVRDVGDLAGGVAGQLDPGKLTDQRGLKLQRLLAEHRDVLDTDDGGHVIVRGELIALSPAPETVAKAQAAGFTVIRRTGLEDLGLEEVVLAPPKGVSARKGLKLLRKLDPAGAYDVNPIYSDSGGVGRVTPMKMSGPSPPAAAAGGARIGLLDSGVLASHPALAGAHVEQQGFTGGGVRPRDHGTAVASLLVGRQGGFAGAAPGATLYAADVYGGLPTGGSAEVIARALAWMGRERPSVVNISLVGPPNALLQAAVRALQGKGVIVVAAVGNDGPAAPPLYPASYPGVVAVTAVDKGRRVLIEAGRGLHVDFAAPGSDMAAAGLGGYLAVRGTSFAAPLVAGRLAALASGGGDPLARLAAEAVNPGGRFGRGLVCESLRIAPQTVGARPWRG